MWKACIIMHEEEQRGRQKTDEFLRYVSRAATQSKKRQPASGANRRLVPRAQTNHQLPLPSPGPTPPRFPPQILSQGQRCEKLEKCPETSPKEFKFFLFSCLTFHWPFFKNYRGRSLAQIKVFSPPRICRHHPTNSQRQLQTPTPYPWMPSLLATSNPICSRS